MREMNPGCLSIGTAQFGLPYGITRKGGQVSAKEVQAILGVALEAGITKIDTAVAYGEAEVVLGGSGVKPFSICTKIIATTYDQTCRDIEGSLARLKVDSIEGVLIHYRDSSSRVELEACLEAIADCKARGLFRKWGYSVYSPSDLNLLLQLSWPDMIQAPLNVFDRRMTVYADGYAQVASGIEFQARSVFLQGLLLQRPNQLPAIFHPLKPLWKRWTDWLEENCLSPTTACIGFANRKPIERILIGIQSLREFQEILSNLPDDYVDVPPDIQISDEYYLDPRNWS